MSKKKNSNYLIIIISSVLAALYPLFLNKFHEEHLRKYGQYTYGVVVDIWPPAPGAVKGKHAVILFEVGDRAYFNDMEINYYPSVHSGDSVIIRFDPKRPDNASCFHPFKSATH